MRKLHLCLGQADYIHRSKKAITTLAKKRRHVFHAYRHPGTVQIGFAMSSYTAEKINPSQTRYNFISGALLRTLSVHSS